MLEKLSLLRETRLFLRRNQLLSRPETRQIFLEIPLALKPVVYGLIDTLAYKLYRSPKDRQNPRTIQWIIQSHIIAIMVSKIEERQWLCHHLLGQNPSTVLPLSEKSLIAEPIMTQTKYGAPMPRHRGTKQRATPIQDRAVPRSTPKVPSDMSK